MNEVNRIIDQNNLNQVDYDTDALEKVRDECADFLKSIEMDKSLDPYMSVDAASAGHEINEGVGEASSDVKVREIAPINSKQGLDKNAAESKARMARMRSGSRTKDDCRAPWDPHHAHCV